MRGRSRTRAAIRSQRSRRTRQNQTDGPRRRRVKSKQGEADGSRTFGAEDSLRCRHNRGARVRSGNRREVRSIFTSPIATVSAAILPHGRPDTVTDRAGRQAAARRKRPSPDPKTAASVSGCDGRIPGMDRNFPARTTKVPTSTGKAPEQAKHTTHIGCPTSDREQDTSASGPGTIGPPSAADKFPFHKQSHGSVFRRTASAVRPRSPKRTRDSAPQNAGNKHGEAPEAAHRGHTEDSTQQKYATGRPTISRAARILRSACIRNRAGGS